MANAERGAVALEAGGKVYSLRFSTNAICELEDHFGKPIMALIEDLDDEEKASMKMVRAMIWGALLEEHPDTQLKDAGKLLDEVGMSVMTEKIGLALQRFFPEAKGKANPPKAKAG